jgi:ribonucrease Y
MNGTNYILFGFGSALAGYALFKALLAILPSRLSSQSEKQASEVIKEAKRQGQSILASKAQQVEDELELAAEELESEIAQSKDELLDEEAIIESRKKEISREETRLQKLEKEVEKITSNVAQTQSEFEATFSKLEEGNQNLVSELEQVAQTSSTESRSRIANTIIDARQLECQKVLKTLNEEMSSTARKKDQSILDRTHSRYAPDFAWPKNTNLVESDDLSKLKNMAENGQQVFEDLKELAQIDISPITSSRDEELVTAIKVAGGFGIHREAARLTIKELLGQRQGAWAKTRDAYQAHAKRLDHEAKFLGKRAVNELRLDGIHPEIQYLIGALNWRTSYRQNQWFHTVEVAVLAGLIASEVGIDPDHAKRVGLLHDIGKAIDYRIEGSHAVISGDYADRFGEKKVICDTVMSHHADLLVETPLAYTLIAADTLSGARPGARINLEEGYQIRLSAIAEAVKSFPGVNDLAIMNGGREVHVNVNYKKVSEKRAQSLAGEIARKIEEDVAYPGQIKVLVSRCFENVTVA